MSFSIGRKVLPGERISALAVSTLPEGPLDLANAFQTFLWDWGPLGRHCLARGMAMLANSTSSRSHILVDSGPRCSNRAIP